MAQNMWIGKANRLARVGELVSVNINGTTVKARVARSFSSTRVLVLKTGNDYYAYPEKVVSPRSINYREGIKHDRKKHSTKYYADAVVIYSVGNLHYVEVNGQPPRLLAQQEFLGGEATNVFMLTNLGYGRYRCAYKYEPFTVFDEYSGQIIPMYRNMKIFTSDNTDILEYTSPQVPPPMPEDWQDYRYQNWDGRPYDLDAVNPCLQGYWANNRGNPNNPPTLFYPHSNLQPDQSIGTVFDSVDLDFSLAYENKERSFSVFQYGPPVYPSQTDSSSCPAILILEQVPLFFYQVGASHPPGSVDGISFISIYYDGDF